MAFDALSEEKLSQLEQVRSRIHDSVSSIIALGDGGWNHGPKLMRAHADAMHNLKSAEALLVEGSEDPAE